MTLHLAQTLQSARSVVGSLDCEQPEYLIEQSTQKTRIFYCC